MGKFVGTAPLGALGLALLSCLGAAGCEGKQGAPGPAGSSQPGPQGDPGPPGGTVGDPSISGITPSTVYVGREVDVTLSGFATQWADGVALDFGPGITATPIAVSSPTALLVHLVIAPDAPLHARTVKVGTLALTDALDVEGPLSAKIVDQWGPVCTDTACDPLPQGSIVLVDAQQRDASTPFGVLPAASLEQGSVSGGITLNVNGQTAYALPYYQFVDFTAPPGDYDAVVEANSVAGAVTSVAPKAFTVAARTPTPLTGSTTGHISKSRETLAYSYQGTALEWVRTEIANPPLGQAAQLVLPKSGAFSDRVAVDGPTSLNVFRRMHFLSTPGEPHYVAVWDGTGEHDYDFGLGVSADPAYDVNGDPTVQFDTIDVPGTSGWYHFEGKKGQTLSLVVGDGPTSACAAQIRAELAVYHDATGLKLLDDDNICPGTLVFCGNSLCLGPPLEVVLPEDGGYTVRVFGSPNYCGGCTFDYGIQIGVSP